MNLSDKQKTSIKFIGICCSILLLFVGATILGIKLKQNQYQPMEVRPPEVVPERFSSVEYVEVAPEYFVPEEVPLVRTTEYVNLTFEEMDLLEHIAMAEAEGEDTIGKALVMCSVLNRSRRDGMSIYAVIYSEGQYATYRMYVEPTDDCHEALAMVIEGWNESQLDLNENRDMRVLYFTNSGYSQYGEPMFKWGNHWFSGSVLE